MRKIIERERERATVPPDNFVEFRHSAERLVTEICKGNIILANMTVKTDFTGYSINLDMCAPADRDALLDFYYKYANLNNKETKQ